MSKKIASTLSDLLLRVRDEPRKPEPPLPRPSLEVLVRPVPRLRSRPVDVDELRQAIEDVKLSRRRLRRLERELKLELARRGVMALKMPWSYQRTYEWPSQETTAGMVNHWAPRYGPDKGKPVCATDLRDPTPVAIVGEKRHRTTPTCLACLRAVREAYRKIVVAQPVSVPPTMGP